MNSRDRSTHSKKAWMRSPRERRCLKPHPIPPPRRIDTASYSTFGSLAPTMSALCLEKKGFCALVCRTAKLVIKANQCGIQIALIDPSTKVRDPRTTARVLRPHPIHVVIMKQEMVPVTPALQPRTSVLPVDKVVDKLCALIVSDNLIKWRNSRSF